MIGACPAQQNSPRDGQREVGPSSVVLLPWAPSSVATARWQLSADLREAGLVAAVIGDAALVLSELLSNAIRHARPLPGALVQVSWALCDGSLTVSVRDGGSRTHPHAEHPPPSLSMDLRYLQISRSRFLHIHSSCSSVALKELT